MFSSAESQIPLTQRSSEKSSSLSVPTFRFASVDSADSELLTFIVFTFGRPKQAKLKAEFVGETQLKLVAN